MRQAVGIDEVGSGQAQSLAVAVHQRSERRFAAGNVLGQRDRGIVAGLDDQAMEQIIELHLAVDRQKAGRTIGARTAAAPGVLADEHFIVPTDAAASQFG